MDQNYSCTCGHIFQFHRLGRNGKFVHCVQKKERMAHYCGWHPDNLKYLEMKYEESLKNVN